MSSQLLSSDFFFLLFRVFSLQDYNTRLVVVGATILGIASGCVGGFVLLRKRSLMGDVLSHATLPGIGIAFILSSQVFDLERSQFVLLIGAACSGIVGVLFVMTLRNTTKLKDDAAMGIVLSVFFGLGISLLGIIQNIPGASVAGLERFIYGKTASMIFYDVQLIVGAALFILLSVWILTKEFTLICFDEAYARTLGWPVLALDVFMLFLLTLVTVVGLQAVGLILIIAFLIIPAAAARFWTGRLGYMVILSSLIGGISGWLGASLSALFQGLPGGAIIVLVASFIFGISLIFGFERGVLKQILEQNAFNKKVAVQHLLRACYELKEQGKYEKENRLVINDLESLRSWNSKQLLKLLASTHKQGLVKRYSARTLSLTDKGWRDAERITRNHRLWELYLINFADIAPSHVDRGADDVEHLLDSETLEILEAQLRARNLIKSMPNSPHE